MAYAFRCRGHENMLGLHQKTLEFTKDDELSLRGDCIVGVGADFDADAVKDLVKGMPDGSCLRVIMSVDSGDGKVLSDSLECRVNPDFDDTREIVIRLGEFVSSRTLGVRATKAAKHLDRALIGRMKDPDCVMEITLDVIERADE